MHSTRKKFVYLMKSSKIIYASFCQVFHLHLCPGLQVIRCTLQFLWTSKYPIKSKPEIHVCNISASVCVWVISTVENSFDNTLWPLSYDPYSPTCSFLAKLCRNSPYDSHTLMAWAGPEKDVWPCYHCMLLFARCEPKQLCCYINPHFSVLMSNVQ